jgi:hypothetical protein
MKIIPIEHGLDLAQGFGAPRSPGVHMSDLYGSLYHELEPKRFKKGGPLPVEKFELGMAFEEMLEEGLRTRIPKAIEQREEVLRPGEFVTDEGVIYSPDLLIFNGVTRLGEIKLTFMSTKGFPWKLGEVYTGFDQKADKYFTQMKCYCHHLKTYYARLYAFFVRGDYKGNDQVFRAWDIEFTARECREEWEWVLDHGKKAGLLK